MLARRMLRYAGSGAGGVPVAEGCSLDHDDFGIQDRGDNGPRGVFYRGLLRCTAALALLVVVLGATVRLADAGLGCPDWPGCFGSPTVAGALASPAAARAARWPDQPLQPGRAHLEMLHRYAAGTLGLLIVGVALLGRRRAHATLLGPLLVTLVAGQALLGMWTVTLRLAPLVVMGHLLGGLTVLSLLWWLVLRDAGPVPGSGSRRMPGLHLHAGAALGALVLQIALGGWVAANGATLACQGFPTCNGAWWPPADFTAGFGLAADGSGSGSGPIAIHWAHRLGAGAVLLLLGSLGLRAARATSPPALRNIARLLLALLAVQLALGIAIVTAGAPLALAASHNAVAALLLLTVLTLVHQLAGGGHPTGEPHAQPRPLAADPRTP